ncbi:MAG: hypothetical protein IPO07_28925 [Haliscomenobacter sp.]|nr:hypothetical protein [Haliscomenobacter sp.]MBK9492363.1 hypothetical protein [Haliscomenobacter sp.]
MAYEIKQTRIRREYTPTRGGQVKFWRIYFFGLQGAKRRRSQSYGEHLQRGRPKKERDKNHLVIPRGVYQLLSNEVGA